MNKSNARSRAGTRSPGRHSRGCRRPSSSATSWSLLGAVYLDNNGNMNAVLGVLERPGLMSVLRRVVREGVDMRHPVSRVMDWAGKHQLTKQLEWCVA
ncbi:hypothetical protein DFH11DRAFT_259844 [Phellopilus nigrolimitatus]|nr:hypothetical protein DFH11DRAFT_259844 [Phellopilus nigrolimitatus]